MKSLKLVLRLSLFANILLFLWGWSQWQQRQKQTRNLNIALQTALNSTTILKDVHSGLDKLQDTMNVQELRRIAIEDQLEASIEELENHVK